MTVPVVPGQFYPTREDLVNTYLRCIAADAGRKGIVVNVLPGSELEMRAQAIASIALPAFGNNKLGLSAVSPLDAVGDQLIEGASAWGVVRRGASKASGLVSVRLNTGFTTATIPAGYQGTCEDGTKFVTTGINTITGPTFILVETVEAGEDVNQAPVAKYTWDSASVGGLRRNGNIGLGGLTGGHDQDTEDTVRARWLERIGSPGSGGNSSHISTLSTNSSAAIQRTYVYPCAQGPGSVAFACVAAEDDRTVSDVVVATAASAVVSELSGRCKINATTVTPEEVDIVISLRLGLPASAGGPGGGWRDAAPWPNDSVATFPKVTSYDTVTGRIITDATALGTLAVGHHIGLWDWTEETMFEGVVTYAAVDGGFVNIGVSGGYPRNFTGAYVSAGAINLADYAATFASLMLALGPGEKSSSSAVLPRARRQPTADVVGPMDLNTRLLSQFQAAHSEVDDVAWAARRATGTTTLKTSPSVPGATTDPPRILVLKHLAFRALQ